MSRDQLSAFRAIREEDLLRYRYRGNNSEMQQDLRDLREKGLAKQLDKVLTYPRTESRHVSTKMIESLPGILQALPTRFDPARSQPLRRAAAGPRLDEQLLLLEMAKDASILDRCGVFSNCL